MNETESKSPLRRRTPSIPRWRHALEKVKELSKLNVFNSSENTPKPPFWQAALLVILVIFVAGLIVSVHFLVFPKLFGEWGLYFIAPSVIITFGTTLLIRNPDWQKPLKSLLDVVWNLWGLIGLVFLFRSVMADEDLKLENVLRQIGTGVVSYLSLLSWTVSARVAVAVAELWGFHRSRREARCETKKPLPASPDQQRGLSSPTTAMVENGYSGKLRET